MDDTENFFQNAIFKIMKENNNNKNPMMGMNQMMGINPMMNDNQMMESNDGNEFYDE